MKKILIIFGTRPEAIKLAPLIKEFRIENKVFETKVCVTAQHRQMLDQVLDFFEIIPDYDLDIMKHNQDLNSLTSSIINNLKDILDGFRPDYAFVHGDTTTTLASSIACFYSKIKVCHVEAGLRTYDLHSPYPEELNRQITSKIAEIHFAPTDDNYSNLINENIPEENIYVTGNTVIDSLFESVSKTKNLKNKFTEKIEKFLEGTKEVILFTGHRRENHGKGFVDICDALLTITKKMPSVKIIYPVHMNPNVSEPVYQLLGNNPNILLLEPLPYQDFIWLMNKSKVILTDSGVFKRKLQV